jgi:hypothetical protein
MLPSLDVTDAHRTKSLLGYKDNYEMNEWVLMGEGDILLLYTDGLVEHTRGDDDYFPGPLERKVRDVKHLAAAGIYEAVKADLLAFSQPTDDISIVVVKRATLQGRTHQVRRFPMMSSRASLSESLPPSPRRSYGSDCIRDAGPPRC